MTSQPILVYVDLEAGPILVGRLWSRLHKGRESASFEYDRGWLEHPERFALEPALMLGAGPHHTAGEQALFGALGDSAPDRWGRALMRRAERRRAEREGNHPHTLGEIEFLLLVDDEARLGAAAASLARKAGRFYLAAPAEDPEFPPCLNCPACCLPASTSFRRQIRTKTFNCCWLAPDHRSAVRGREGCCARSRDGQLALAEISTSQRRR